MCHLLWSRVQRPRNVSRPQEGTRDHRYDSPHGQATERQCVHWEEQQTRSFQKIKALIAKANETPLRYYDRMKPVKVQADASLRGLGACLIQEYKGEDQPIAFASKSLTDAETRYANIERELLAIILPARGSACIYSEEASSQRATTNHWK